MNAAHHLCNVLEEGPPYTLFSMLRLNIDILKKQSFTLPGTVYKEVECKAHNLS